jgi:serine/threonine protein kinase/tetratricopeptide (TPR) repeat protein
MPTPNQERWSRIEALVDGVLEIPGPDRDAWLRRACDGEAGLYEEVHALIEAGEREDGFLSRPPGPGADELLRFPAAGPVPPTPQRIGPYRVVREIGRGGMGTVYLAEREEHFEQRVAVKLVGRGLHVAEHLLRRFLEERQLLASMEHANIARVLDGGVTDEGLPWFAMEFVEGKPLDRWCDERRLTIEARLELFCSVCEAVEYAHQRRIVHRDLKPTNILVRDDGIVKLLDFGIAKLMPDRDSEHATTQPGWRLLTPEYASPEQVRGDTASPESDVYTLGVLLYELLTGRRPIARRDGMLQGQSHDVSTEVLAPSAAVTLEAPGGNAAPAGVALTPTGVARARSTTPERLSARLTGDLDRVILHALAFAPDRRYATAGAFGADVRRHLDGMPVSARAGRPRWLIPVGALAASVVAVLAIARWRSAQDTRPVGDPVLAVGLIADHRAAAAPREAGPLSDLLATNLARSPTLRVVSNARLYELMGRGASNGPLDAGLYNTAARRAGATMLVDGSLYALGGDSLRLDLRRIDVASGEVFAAYSVVARDLFTLVDSGTARVAAGLGAAAAAGSIADVTTHSETAYRFYQEGLRAHYAGDQVAARGLLHAALREDSALAMASYYLARTQMESDDGLRALAQALRMAARASERERLVIQAAWALFTSDPSAIVTADSLLRRYPQDLDGPLFAGRAYAQAGELHAALPLLRQVIIADSLAGRAAPGCPGCDARDQVIDAYISMDSLGAAEREAASWTRFEPERARAWLWLSRMRSILGKSDLAFDAYHRAAGIDPGLSGQPSFFARTYLVVGDYERLDRQLREVTRSGSAVQAIEAWWYLTLSLRQQGRLQEALTAARVFESDVGRPLSATQRQAYTRLLGQVLHESGRDVESAALLATAANNPPGATSSHRARDRAWTLGLSGTALASLGDTARLLALIEPVRQAGEQSLSVRDRLLHHHLSGLLLAARGDDQGAELEFRQSLSLPTGYTRSQYELGRVLLRRGRPRDAVATLQPAARAPIEGAHLYLSATDRRALLAEAWDSAGGRDSALVHYRVVLNAWRRADPSLSTRKAAIQARVLALEAAGSSSPGR